MKRAKIDLFLGKKVMVTLFDGTNFNGELHKTGEEIFKNNPNLYIPQKCYVLIDPQTCILKSCVFKSSHIKKIHETYMSSIK